MQRVVILLLIGSILLPVYSYRSRHDGQRQFASCKGVCLSCLLYLDFHIFVSFGSKIALMALRAFSPSGCAG